MSKAERIGKLRNLLINLGPLPTSDDVPVIRDVMIEMLDIMKGQFADNDEVTGRVDEIELFAD